MSEGTDSSTPKSELEQPAAASAPTDKGKKKLWLMIAAIAVAILLIGSVAYVFVLAPKDKLEAVISPDPVGVDAGAAKALSVKVTWGGSALAASTSGLDYLWSVEPVAMGSFNLRAVADVTFKAAYVGGDGKIKCEVTYKGKTTTAEVVLSINPPILDAVVIDPSTKTLAPNQGFTFNATALSSVAIPIVLGVNFTWTVTGLTTTQYTLSPTTGPSVNFTGLVEGLVNLTAQTTYNGVTKSGSANITVGTTPVRSLNYRYYDFFNVPFGEWWNVRWDKYHSEQIISYTYPTMFYWYSAPPGNIWIYSNMMLDVKGRNMSSINMNSWPEFLPLLGTARGGNADLDWFMQYLTTAEMARFPPPTQASSDGWLISLNGTTTMDRQAAMAVLNVTSAGFDDFANWWAANNVTVKTAYTAWMLKEGNKRLDIYNMNEYQFVPLAFDLSAQKVGDKIVLTYDIVSWGMECLMSRWLHEAFQPVEHFFEGFNLHANIGPERADIDITTAIAYGIYAYETTVVPDGKTHGDPCWVFETYPQDILSPSIGHPHSDITPYLGLNYTNNGPGSKWYGQNMTWDYSPGAFNLSENETLHIEFPTGPQLFKEQAYYSNGTPNVYSSDVNQRVVNATANMTYNYAEPYMADNPQLSPGSMSVDQVAGRITYTGPIDFWTWSKDQTTHQTLADEWDRLGGNLIPYGIPYVEFTWEQPPAAPRADHYAVSAMSSPVIAGEPVTFNVTVYDQYNNVFPSYVGTLNFTSTGGAAVLPGNYTFTTTDAGIHAYSNLTFGTAGLHNLMLVDAANSSLTGQYTGINVLAAAAADHFVLSGIPNVVVINEPQNVTVTVYDQYNRLFVGYTGTIAFGSNRSADVVLPSDTTVPAGQNHVTILGGVTFTATGWFMVNASDDTVGTIKGETVLQVELEAPHLDHFVVTGETELAPAEYYDLTVEAVNQFDSTFQTYTGTVHFATDAPGGSYVLPGDTTFAPADNGVKVFAGAMRFNLTGTYEVNVSDTVTTTAYGLLPGINVAARPNIVYTVYDFFQEPWGEWYWNPAWRPGWYFQDYLVSNTSGQSVQLYDPGQDGKHGVLYAPYRFNMTATNVSNVDVHHPEFMPILGGVGPQAGAQAEMHIRNQYLDHAWWNSYWVPQFGASNPFFPPYLDANNDGYMLGTVITMDLNREAALEWLGMPTTVDPLTWWGTHQIAYEDAWTEWVDNEGNHRLDIYCGYADFYYVYWTFSNMSVASDGDILLRISHIGNGFEVLMTRWLTESQLCVHQPYMEDFDMESTYGNGIANVTFDAVGQYSFHAAKANGSASNDGAWVWEPTRIDYWPSWSNDPAYHPSDYDPYAGAAWGRTTTYQSWNSGDPLFGQEVQYDSTPQWFNLTEFQTLIVKLPTASNVIGYEGKGVGPQGIFNLSTGDYSEYNAMKYTGRASLGYVVTNPANPLDMASVYDPINKTLTFQGPYDFNNPGGRTGILYHGAPWIEFNVLSTLKTEAIAEPTPEVASETAPAVTAEMLSLAAVICGVLLAVPALVSRRRWDE